MSDRERSRYLTVTVVFLAALIVLGSLMVKTAIVMAQVLEFTFRPHVSSSNTYSGGIPSTTNLDFASDANALTAATTHTNADFSGNGVTPDDGLTWSGLWMDFDPTTTFLKDIGLYVIRGGIGNDETGLWTDQWSIEYSIDAGGEWLTLDDPTISGDNPAKSEVTTFSDPGAIPNTTDLKFDLLVRTLSRQESAANAALKIYDIRVEAEWNDLEGGPYPLQIDTYEILPPGVKDVAYTPVDIEASGGNSPYSWCLVSGSLPSGMAFSPSLPNCSSSSVQNATIELSGTPTAGGDFTFKIKVTDDSSTIQTASKEFTLHIAGLAIDPPGPGLRDWDPVVADTFGGQTFTPEGGTGPYDWCLVTGSLPPGLSWLAAPAACDLYTATTAASMYLSGTPTDPGYYSFTMRLADSGGETPAEHHYAIEVSSGYVTILKRLLKPVVKGISYGKLPPPPTQMTPQYLRAINLQYSTDVSEVAWSVPEDPLETGLPPGFSLSGATLNTVTETSSVYIGGTIDVDENSGVYDFTVDIIDDATKSDSESFELEVLERRTLLSRTPPSAVVLPDDHKLDFVVSARGGAPSKEDDTALDGGSVPYYNYFWLVTAEGDSTPLKDADGNRYHVPAATDRKAGPDTLGITFIDASDRPVIGTYTVTFWAQDKLARDNAPDAGGNPANHPADIDTNDAYEFVPATARIKIISPAGRTLEKDATRPTLLRQEQFR